MFSPLSKMAVFHPFIHSITILWKHLLLGWHVESRTCPWGTAWGGLSAYCLICSPWKSLIQLLLKQSSDKLQAITHLRDQTIFYLFLLLLITLFILDSTQHLWVWTGLCWWETDLQSLGARVHFGHFEVSVKTFVSTWLFYLLLVCLDLATECLISVTTFASSTTLSRYGIWNCFICRGAVWCNFICDSQALLSWGKEESNAMIPFLLYSLKTHLVVLGPTSFL